MNEQIIFIVLVIFGFLHCCWLMTEFVRFARGRVTMLSEYSDLLHEEMKVNRKLIRSIIKALNLEFKKCECGTGNYLVAKKEAEVGGFGPADEEESNG
jgi:hypothetical protein